MEARQTPKGLVTLALAVALGLLVAASFGRSGTQTQETAAIADVAAPTATETTTASAAAPDPAATPEPTATPQPSATPVPTATPEPTALPTATPVPTPTFVVPEEPLFEQQGELPISVTQVNETILFVEHIAEREFLYPPTVITRTLAEFRSEIIDGDLTLWQNDALFARRLQALGHTTIGVQDFENTLTTSTADGVGGFFDPEADALTMPTGVYASDLFAQILVHELVHALDAQHADVWRSEEFDRDALAESGDYEPIRALGAVVEGRARFIESAWSWPEHWPAPTSPDRSELPARPTPAPAAQRLPRVIYEEAQAPYLFGKTYIQTLGGAAATWHLYDEAPQTTEQILHPGTAGQPIVLVEPPMADGPILETRVFGALDLGLAMTGRGSIVSTSRGWAGGHSTMWGDDESTCIRFALASDTPEDQQRIFKTITRWVDADEDGRTASIEGDRIVATSCAPFVP